MKLKKTIVYIDGFNLYYGCLKGTPYRWLDLSKLSKLLLKKNKILKIKYFTAKVKPLPGNLDCHIRQYQYLRALESIKCCELFFGTFKSNKKQAVKANYTGKGNKFVNVIDTKEKGSDVNLATEMLCDGFNNKYEMAVLVSNDSDFQPVLKAIKKKLKKDVAVINPHPLKAAELFKLADYYKEIRKGVLENSQFESTVVLKDKTEITKPENW